MKSIQFMIPALLIFTGCGNLAPTFPIQVPASAYQLNIPPASSQIQTQYNCTETSFIEPQFTSTNVVDVFQACPSSNSSDYSDILIKGTTNLSNNVCVFPIEANSSNPSNPLAGFIGDPNTGLPIYLCLDLSSTGTVFSFQNNAALSEPVTSSFNAVAIVESTAVEQLVECMKDPAVECPHYSYGQFR